ncbi:hypothetical protein M6B38_190950 [Iris pallida]|uniref:Uncharacterized protein n=1 Tax=Iris pallida TaxID=29817 RepID=A0AAX6EF63_IRIPA|nr:hypothetical protein M6B38_190950 [Iris pallida]
MEAHLRRRPRRRSDHGGFGGWTVDDGFISADAEPGLGANDGGTLDPAGRRRGVRRLRRQRRRRTDTSSGC